MQIVKGKEIPEFVTELHSGTVHAALRAADNGTAELCPTKLPFNAVHSGENGHKSGAVVRKVKENHPVKPFLFSVSILQSELFYSVHFSLPHSAFCWFFFLAPC